MPVPRSGCTSMLQQHCGHNVCVHPDVEVSYVRYIACTNNLRSSISGSECNFSYVKTYDVISGLMMSHL